MKGIRKIAGKVTALAVAITTSVALLSPYDGNAQSGTSTGGGTDPQYNCAKKSCYYYTDFEMQSIEYISNNNSTSKNGSGGGSIGKNGGSLNGSGGSSNSNGTVTKVHTYYARLCYKPGGCLTSCAEMNGLSGSGTTKTCSN